MSFDRGQGHLLTKEEKTFFLLSVGYKIERIVLSFLFYSKISSLVVLMTSSLEDDDPLPVEMLTRQKIYLYVQRYATVEENFKIRAYFENEIKFTFHRLEIIDPASKMSPFIYRAELDLGMDQNHRLYFNDSHGLIRIGNYRLRLSRKFAGLDSTFRDYNEAKTRSIALCGHYFIFDVEFADRLVVDSPPGYNVPFCNQLYLYTFLLLRLKMYDVVDILFQQFRASLPENNRPLFPEELNQFFQGCGQHYRYSIPPVVNQNLANKILIQMTGILPIVPAKFQLDNPEAIKFVRNLLEDIRAHYPDILANVIESDWITFRDGLVFYFSIELLTQSKDTIQLIEQMQVEDLRRDLANCILKRLEEFQRPVLGLNWTNLFNHVDPNILSINQLGLTRSIETYINCLVIFFGQEWTDTEISQKINRHFDDLIRTDRLPGKDEYSPRKSFLEGLCLVHLTNIEFLVRFLQMESTETDESLKAIMKKVINTIESSVNLREKMRRYLYSLKIPMESFGTIRLIISAMSTVSILFPIRRRDLLINLMNYSTNNYSYDFFKQWFFSFLVFDDEITEVNKREYQDLLQPWWKQIMKLPEIIMKIFGDIDRFIEAFQNANYQMIFILQMIQFIFEQSQSVCLSFSSHYELF